MNCTREHRIGDLISCRDGGEACTIADKLDRPVSEYGGQCIDMRADELLISACGVRRLAIGATFSRLLQP